MKSPISYLQVAAQQWVVAKSPRFSAFFSDCGKMLLTLGENHYYPYVGGNMPSDADHAHSSERLARLWMEVQPSVLSFICAAIPQFPDAEDVLQEVAVEAAQHFSQYDPQRPFVAWAIGIAKFKIAAFYRCRPAEALLWDDTALDSIAQVHAIRHDTLAQHRDAMDYCLEALPNNYRSLLLMRYADDLRSPEIAQRIGSTASAVRVTLNRIRTRLSKCMEVRLAQETRP